MENLLDLAFTKEISGWLNKFTLDLAKNPEKIRDSIKDFTGDRNVVEVALEKGPDFFKKSEDACLALLNFVEFYATGKISEDIKVRVRRDKNVIEQ